MKLQCLQFLGLLWLLSPFGHQAVLADPDQVYCAPVGADFYHIGNNFCQPGESCGVDRVTGEIQGCVTADKCPDHGGTDKFLVCSPTKPSCCCKTILGKNPENTHCNHMRSPADDRPWKRACSMAEFKNLPICQVNPTTQVYCGSQSNCGPSRLCGISKASGKLRHCLEPSDCPANAKSSREIVCDPGSPFCCCQVHTPKDTRPVGSNCNNYIEDYVIWKQACGLKELRDLKVCKGDPPSTTTTTTTTEEPPITPGPTEQSTETLVLWTDEEDLMDKGTDETLVSTAAIVIGGMIVLLIIGGLVYVCWFKKQRQAGGTPWTYQQQQLMPQQAYQQPIRSA